LLIKSVLFRTTLILSINVILRSVVNNRHQHQGNYQFYYTLQSITRNGFTALNSKHFIFY
jgi:hypothetical protein